MSSTSLLGSLVPAGVIDGTGPSKALESLATVLAPAASAFFFLEARLLAGGAATVGQQGLAKLAPQFASKFGVVVRPVDGVGITVFSKTSGMLLIAGVGSYYAYRLGRRMLVGRIFTPWVLYEATACDFLARADSRLLHPASEGFYEVRVGSDDLDRLQKFFESVSERTDATSSTVASASVGSHCGALLRRLAEDVAALRRDDCGLAAICQQSSDQRTSRHLEKEFDSIQLFSTIPSWTDVFQPSNSDIYSRHDDRRHRLPQLWDIESEYQDADDIASISGASELTSVSRTRDGVAFRLARRRHKQRQQSVEKPERESGGINDMDTFSETASTSLRLAWPEEPFWDDDFAGDYDHNRASPTPSGISDLSAVLNLEAIFKDHERRDASIAHRIALARPATRAKTSTAAAPSPLRRRAAAAVAAVVRERKDGAASTLSSRWDNEVLARCFDDNPGYMYQSAVVDRSNLAPSESDHDSELTRHSRSVQRDFDGNASNASQSIALRLRDSASSYGRLFSEGLWELATTVSRDSRASSSVSVVPHGRTPLAGAQQPPLPSILSRVDVAVVEILRQLAVNTGKDYVPAAMFDSAIAMTESMSSSAAAVSSAGSMPMPVVKNKLPNDGASAMTQRLLFLLKKYLAYRKLSVDKIHDPKTIQLNGCETEFCSEK